MYISFTYDIFFDRSVETTELQACIAA